MTHKVLIVDDEPNIVVALEYLMRQNGFDVRAARNGEEALALLGEFRPDLVLLDVMMPRKDGYQVAQTIRDTPALAGTRIVMLTAKGRETEISKGLAVGADAYITKPFSTLELVEQVKRMLDA
ncbi:MAG: response regulator transcription factor [Betaproteobacteria bacterium]|jgi:DNA-binding response OmpR family regulator